MRIKYTKLLLTLALTTGISSTAFADGNAFTPLNFDDVSMTTPKAIQATTPKVEQNGFSNAISKIMPAKKDMAMTNLAPGEVPVGNDNIQNAILELDNAQVGIRNDLLDYRAKYADTDAQYKLVKNERAMLNKQVKSIERRIKNIDKAKEKIRKNML